MLSALEAEHEGIETSIRWASAQGHADALLALYRGAEYFYFVRGLWGIKKELNLLAAEAAQHLGRNSDEVHAVASQVHILSVQGCLAEAEPYVRRLEALLETVTLIGDRRGADIALVIYWLGRGEYHRAEQLLAATYQRHLEETPLRGTVNRRWYAHCRYLQGHIDEARQLFEAVLEQSLTIGYTRGVLFSRIKLAAIYLEGGELELAEQHLAQAAASASHIFARHDMASATYLTTRLHTLRGDLPAARASLAEAIDLFERLGMRRELAEARAELAKLDT
ncbi:MAG: hypothetical protein HGA65_08530 [Oscillochloris sp.]|nr:hypothetical protein [Oscillochloris sp.]